MWKAIGSVRSGDDRSVRSNKSRDQIRFQHFQTKSIDRSRQKSVQNKSFCEDYFQKRRQNPRNNTFDQRPKSQKSIRQQQSNKEDIFTSMRNVNLSQKGSEYVKSGVKENDSSKNKIVNKTNSSSGNAAQNANNKIKNLKKDQKKLKKMLEQQLTSFKNVMLQLQDTIIHNEIKTTNNENKSSNKSQNSNEKDYQLLKQIIAEANGISSFFNELDRKKDAILANIGSEK